jgi:hypothetical protein
LTSRSGFVVCGKKGVQNGARQRPFPKTARGCGPVPGRQKLERLDKSGENVGNRIVVNLLVGVWSQRGVDNVEKTGLEKECPLPRLELRPFELVEGRKGPVK